MDATTELTRLSGLQQLQAIFAGKTGYAGIVNSISIPFQPKKVSWCLRGRPHKRSIIRSARCMAATSEES
jgi:hypothetical protein